MNTVTGLRSFGVIFPFILSFDYRLYQHTFYSILKGFFSTSFPKIIFFIFYSFVVYEPVKRNFHISCMSRTQAWKKIPFNWLHSFFTWLFLYHKEVTKSLFQSVALCVTIFLQMKLATCNFTSNSNMQIVEWNLILTGAIHSTNNFQKFQSKLNGSVQSNLKSFKNTGPPFEVDHFSGSDRSEFCLNGSYCLIVQRGPVLFDYTSLSVAFFLMQWKKSTVIFPTHPCISFTCD